jgi:hypothetical protein
MSMVEQLRRLRSELIEERILIKASSHRSRESILRTLGDPERQSYASLERETGGGVFEVTPEELAKLEKALKTGTFKRFKDGPDVRKARKMMK